MDSKALIEKIEQGEFSKIKFAVSDIDGILRGKYIHKDKLIKSLKNGIGFCDVIFGWDSGDICYDNAEVTGWHSGYPDAKAAIDLNSYREIPWENFTPFVLGDFSKDEYYAKSVCPRSLLKRIKADCENMGFSSKFSQEFEWFNFKNTPLELYESDFQNLTPITPGMFGYSILRASYNNAYFNDLFEYLKEFDVALEGLHTETGPGVFEAAIICDDILNAADKAILFKTAVKEIAYRHEFLATFMAKWNLSYPGSGGHIHQSLWNDTGKNNLFYDQDRNYGMSVLAEQYIAGQLECLPYILPMYAPTINSYKRLTTGDWAPSTVSWGVDNRTAAIRLIPEGAGSTRTELRVPGADMNPYLAMAASLASGLYGIKKKLNLKHKETKGNAYKKPDSEKLPITLQEATEKMKNSELAKELFGEAFVNHFSNTREWECRQHKPEDDTWELKRYFEII